MIKNLFRLFCRLFEDRILEKKVFYSFPMAKDYIDLVSKCWGGGKIRENLVSDVSYSKFLGFLNETEEKTLIDLIPK